MSFLKYAAWAPVCLALSLLSSPAQAQFYKLHNADVAFSAQGQFTTPLTNQGPGYLTQKDSVGALVTLRDHPFPWLGIEINGGMTDFSETFHYPQGTVGAAAYRTKTYETEATAGYLFHLHTPWVQPFVAVGGGAVNFLTDPMGYSQWRGAGMYDLGFDITSGHVHAAQIGLRIEEHSLVFRAPNYDNPQFRMHSWVNQNSPSVGAFVRW